MFEYIYQWIQNLAFYMILVTAVLHVVPDNSYRKYIRFYCGLVLVVMLSAPIIRLAGAEEMFKEIYQNIKYEETLRQMQKADTYLREIEAPIFEESGGD